MESLFKVGIIFEAIDKVTSTLKQIDSATKNLNQTTTQTTVVFQRLKERIEDLKPTFDSLAQAAVAGGAFGMIMKSYADLENASVSLKATFMEAGGVVPVIFSEIDREAKKLGAELPGTTADFYRLASVMKQLGVESEIIARGGLRSAAYLAAVLRIPYEEAGEAVAKFSNALGIAGEDLIKFMDLVQRLGHMGVDVTEMRYAFADLSGTIKVLGWQGYEMSKPIATLVGMLIQTGKTGRTVGNALADMFRVMLDTEKVNKVNALLSEFGIRLNFIDEQTGKLKTPELLAAELGKIGEAMKAGILSQEKAIQIFKNIFGTGEQAEVAMILATKGAEGYNKMSDALARQASLQKRIAEISNTLSNLWEALTGTVKNLLATIGEGLSPVLKALIPILNRIADFMSSFFEKHKTLGAIIAGSIGAIALFATSILAVGTVLSVMKGPLMMSLLIFTKLGGITGILAGTFKILAGTITLVGTALRFLFLSTPIGWIAMGVTILIGVGYLLWRHWDKVSKVLVSAWNWLKENWKRLLQVFLWINPITAPIMALDKLARYVFGINLFPAGQKIIKSLWEGIKSIAMKPVETIKDIAQRIRNLLPFSPAKEGPLRDLHRVKIIETIAETVKVTPLVSAVWKVLEPVRSVVQPLIQPVKQVLEPVRSVVQPLIRPVSLSYGGTIIINVSTGPIQITEAKDAHQIALNLQKEIETALNKINLDRFRRAY